MKHAFEKGFISGMVFLAICIGVSSCASLPRSYPTQARITVQPVQKGDQGFYFKDDDKVMLISDGVPESWFQSTPRGWYLSKQHEERAADIREKLRNP